MSIEITMPRLSDTMESGTIIKWNVTEGEAVASGAVVADVETDKATMELSSFDDGTMAAILVSEGETVDVGSVIAVLAEAGEDLASVKASAGSGGGSASNGAAPPAAAPAAPEAPAAAPASAAPAPTPAPAPSAPAAAPAGGGGGRMRISPVARRLAEEHGLDVAQIQGTGPNGRIIKRDVLKAIDAAGETAAAIPPSALARSGDGAASIATPIVAAHGETQRVPLSGMRQTIARRLVESKTSIPHYQVTLTFNMDPLLEMRKTLNAQLEPAGVKLSVNDFLVRCCALAMSEHPDFNASFDGDAILYHGAVNVGVAISLPPERGGGLVVATIRNADQKSLRVISAETKALAEKARTKGLAVEDMSDATFTLSNLGMFGVEHFTAIINPPNSAILAVGAAIQKPVVRDGELAVGHEMSATMSSDHRVIDGAMAARYLGSLKHAIENPSILLV